MRILDIDLETFAEQSVVALGAPRYSELPSAEILIFGYALPGVPPRPELVKQWVPLSGEPMPDDLRAELENPDTLISAWNKGFEYYMLKNTMGIHVPHSRWVDPMLMGFRVAMPGGLARVCTIMGLGEEYAKQDSGTRLINLFSMPRKPTKKDKRTRVMPEEEPEQWLEYLEYNRFDVVAQRRIRQLLTPYQ